MTAPSVTSTYPYRSLDTHGMGIYASNGNFVVDDNGNVTAAGSTTNTGRIVASTGISVTAGGATITGGVTTDLLQGGSPTAIATVADSGTIVISRRVAKVSGAAGATVAAAAIATSGAVGGQELIVLNENTTVGSTLVISTNVILKAGTTSVTVSGLAGARFIFDDTQSKWVNV